MFQHCTRSLAWMPDELSPAHNIVCSGSSVWHRSVEEKLCLVWKPTRPIKLSGRALYDDGQMIRPIKLSGRASYDAGQIPRAELPGRAASGAPGPRSSGPPHGGHTGLVPGSGEERCLRAAGSTHIWRHSELFSPVNTKTSEIASAAVVTYYVALIGCRSIQLSEEAFYFLVRVETRPIITAQWSGLRLTFWLELWVWQRQATRSLKLLYFQSRDWTLNTDVSKLFWDSEAI